MRDRGYISVRKPDASQDAIVVVLNQLGEQGGEVALAFASKTLCATWQWYCTIKLELYTVVYFMHYFQGYIDGARVVIRMNHAVLKWLIDGSQICKDTCHGQIEHWPGWKHGNADGPSRPYHIKTASIPDALSVFGSSAWISCVRERTALIVIWITR